MILDLWTLILELAAPQMMKPPMPTYDKWTKENHELLTVVCFTHFVFKGE